MSTNAIKCIDFDAVLGLAREAGGIAKFLRDTDQLEIEYKEDGSPVTNADLFASHIITSGLSRLTPDIPIISEEAPEEENMRNITSHMRWIIDPIDGTQTYIDGYEGYGVHIGLAAGEDAVAGFVFFPDEADGAGVAYYTDKDGRALKQVGDNTPQELRVISPGPLTKLTAAIGWKDEVERIRHERVNTIQATGGGRICVVAAGEADIMMVHAGHVKQWDVTAAIAVFNRATGEVRDVDTGQITKLSQEKLSMAPFAAASPQVLQRLGFTRPAPASEQAQLPVRRHTAEGPGRKRG